MKFQLGETVRHNGVADVLWKIILELPETNQCIIESLTDGKQETVPEAELESVPEHNVFIVNGDTSS